MDTYALIDQEDQITSAFDIELGQQTRTLPPDPHSFVGEIGRGIREGARGDIRGAVDTLASFGNVWAEEERREHKARDVWTGQEDVGEGKIAKVGRLLGTGIYQTGKIAAEVLITKGVGRTLSAAGKARLFSGLVAADVGVRNHGQKFYDVLNKTDDNVALAHASAFASDGIQILTELALGGEAMVAGVFRGGKRTAITPFLRTLSRSNPQLRAQIVAAAISPTKRFMMGAATTLLEEGVLEPAASYPSEALLDLVMTGKTDASAEELLRQMYESVIASAPMALFGGGMAYAAQRHTRLALEKVEGDLTKPVNEATLPLAWAKEGTKGELTERQAQFADSINLIHDWIADKFGSETADQVMMGISTLTQNAAAMTMQYDPNDLIGSVRLGFVDGTIDIDRVNEANKENGSQGVADYLMSVDESFRDNMLNIKDTAKERNLDRVASAITKTTKEEVGESYESDESLIGSKLSGVLDALDYIPAVEAKTRLGESLYKTLVLYGMVDNVSIGEINARVHILPDGGVIAEPTILADSEEDSLSKATKRTAMAEFHASRTELAKRIWAGETLLAFPALDRMQEYKKKFGAEAYGRAMLAIAELDLTGNQIVALSDEELTEQGSAIEMERAELAEEYSRQAVEAGVEFRGFFEAETPIPAPQEPPSQPLERDSGGQPIPRPTLGARNSADIPITLEAETFTLGSRTWDVRQAKKIIQETPRTIEEVNIEGTDFLTGIKRGGATIAIDKTAAEKADTDIPIIGFKDEDGNFFPIDGWHRVFKARKAGATTLPAIVLTESEARVAEGLPPAPTPRPTPEAETEAEKRTLTGKEQKAFLLGEIDTAIQAAPDMPEELLEKYEKQIKKRSAASEGVGDAEAAALVQYFKEHAVEDIIFEVPDDGTFTVKNTKQTLGRFRKRVFRLFPSAKPSARKVRHAKRMHERLRTSSEQISFMEKKLAREVEPDLLFEEARKYKTAEEFVESQGITSYHGTTTTFDKFDLGLLGENTKAKSASLGVFSTESKSVAQRFGGGKESNIKELRINLKNPVEFATPLQTRKTALGSTVPIKGTYSRAEFLTEEGNLVDLQKVREIGDSFEQMKRAVANVNKKTTKELTVEDYVNWKEKLIELGYDGVKLKDAIVDSNGQTHTTYIVFAPSQIKTTQQLTDIWNEANKKALINAGKEGLLAEAKKYDTSEDFEKAWLREIKHGQYWHVTYDPNFKIDPTRGPRDMSSLAQGREDVGKLMITSNLEEWAESYSDKIKTGGKPREYVALIDMSNVPKEQYKQVNRGFGNEFYVNQPQKAKVIAVLPIKEALKISAKWDKQKPQNKQQLTDIWNKAQEGKIDSHPEYPEIKITGKKEKAQVDLLMEEALPESGVPGDRPEVNREALGFYDPASNFLAFSKKASAETLLHEWLHHLIRSDFLPASFHDALRRNMGGRWDEEKAIDLVASYITKMEMPQNASPEVVTTLKALKGAFAETTSRMEVSEESRKILDVWIHGGSANMTVRDLGKALLSVMQESNSNKYEMEQAIVFASAEDLSHYDDKKVRSALMASFRGDRSQVARALLDKGIDVANREHFLTEGNEPEGYTHQQIMEAAREILAERNRNSITQGRMGVLINALRERGGITEASISNPEVQQLLLDILKVAKRESTREEREEISARHIALSASLIDSRLSDIFEGEVGTINGVNAMTVVDQYKVKETRKKAKSVLNKFFASKGYPSVDDIESKSATAARVQSAIFSDMYKSKVIADLTNYPNDPESRTRALGGTRARLITDWVEDQMRQGLPKVSPLHQLMYLVTDWYTLINDLSDGNAEHGIAQAFGNQWVVMQQSRSQIETETVEEMKRIGKEVGAMPVNVHWKNVKVKGVGKVSWDTLLYYYAHTRGNLKKKAAPLIEEAKKYKTAEEFVKAQGETYYHGTEEQVKSEELDTGSFTTEKELAVTFAGVNKKDWKVHQVKLKINNPIRVEDPGLWISDEFTNQLAEQNILTKQEANKLLSKAQEKINRREGWKIITDALKEKGYDGIVYKNKYEGKKTDTYIPFIKEQIKTKAQLTDIWNKAQEGKVDPLYAFTPTHDLFLSDIEAKWKDKKGFEAVVKASAQLVAQNKEAAAAVKNTDRILDFLYARMSRMAETMRGKPMPKRHDYFPSMRKGQLYINMDELAGDTETLATKRKRTATGAGASTLARVDTTKTKGQPMTSFTYVLNRYMEAAYTYIGSYPHVQKMKLLLSDEDVVNAFRLAGKTKQRELMLELIDRERFVNGRPDPHGLLERGVRGFMTRWRWATLAGRMPVAMIQPMSAFAQVGRLPGGFFGMKHALVCADAMRHILPAAVSGRLAETEIYKTMVKHNSRHLHAKHGHYTADILRQVSGLGGVQFKVKGKPTTLTEAGMWMIHVGDRVGRMPAWWTAYQYKLNEGLKTMNRSEAEIKAARFAEQETAVTQPAGVISDRNLAQTKNEYMRAMVPFTGFWMKMWSQIRTDGVRPVKRAIQASVVDGKFDGMRLADNLFRVMVSGRGVEDFGTSTALTKKLFWGIALPAFTIGLIRRGRAPEDEEEYVKDLISYTLMAIPVVGPMFVNQSTYRYAEAHFMPLTALNDIVRVPVRAAAKLGVAEKPPGDMLEDFAQMSRYAGLPAQLIYTMNELMDIDTDKALPKEIAKAVAQSQFTQWNKENGLGIEWAD